MTRRKMIVRFGSGLQHRLRLPEWVEVDASTPLEALTRLAEQVDGLSELLFRSDGRLQPYVALVAGGRFVEPVTLERPEKDTPLDLELFFALSG